MQASRQPAILGRRDRHKADKRARIARAARQRFATVGYDAATTAHIAQSADVAVGTLFQYAATKPELLIMVMNDEVAACVQAGAAAAAVHRTREAAVMAYLAPLLALAAVHEENFSVFIKEVLFGPSGQHRDAALGQVQRIEAALCGLLAQRDDREPQPPQRQDADLTNAARALAFAVLLEVSSSRLGLHPATTTTERVRAQLDLVLHGILRPRAGDAQ